MASSARGAPPPAEPPGSPRFEQRHHEQRPHGSPHSSPGGSLSAPHSTVAGASEAIPGTILVPSSPDSGSACSTGIGSAAPVWPARPTRPGVSCSTAAPDVGGDECEGKRTKNNATAVVFVDPELSRRNVDVDVEAGSGAVVRWICGSAGGGDEGAGDGREALALSGSGRSVDGQGQQREAGSGGREGTEGPALSGAPSSTNLTVTIVSDEGDEPPVTCHVPPDGGCCEKIFDRPGSYTYYVCSGPLTMGRVVATAPKCQPQSIAVASSPPACLKGYDAGGEGVEDLAVLEVASAKSDTALDGHSSEVCASQDGKECRSAATEECDLEAVKAGDSPGQDEEHGASQEAGAADILDGADAKQSPLDRASHEGGQCTAADGHSSEVCASQDKKGCHAAAAQEADPEMTKAGDSPGQDQEPGASQEAGAADVLDVANAKQSPLECASPEGGQSTAADAHSSEVCVSQDKKDCHSAATEGGDPELVKAGDSPGQDQEPGAAQEAVAADMLDVADAKQSPLEGASLGGGQCATVDGHSSEVCASQDERGCCSAATEECDSEMVKTGGLPGQDQEHGFSREAVAASIFDVADAKQPPLEVAEVLTSPSQDSVGDGRGTAVDGDSSEVCALQDQNQCRSAATEDGGAEMVKARDSPGGQDQDPSVAQEAVAEEILDVVDAKQSPLEGASLGGGQCTAVDGHSSEVCASQDERERCSAATEECDSEMVKTGGLPGQDQEHGVSREAVAADIFDAADAKQSPLEVAEMPTSSSQDSVGGGQCTAVEGHSSEVCASQDNKECLSAAMEEGNPEMVETGGLPGQDQEHGVSREEVAADILDVTDAQQPPLDCAEMLTLSSQDSVGGEQCVDDASREAEDAAKMSAGEEAGAQSSGDHGASEFRLREKQTPNHPPPVVPLSPVEGNSERWPLQGADKEILALSDPSPSLPISPERENSERSSLQGAEQKEQAPDHPSPRVPLSPCSSVPLSPGEGNIERLPLQGAGQDGSSLTGDPELESGGTGSRNQPPMPAVVTSVGSAQREGDCECGESTEGKGDDEVGSAVDHRRDNENGEELYTCFSDDPDRAITPQTNSPASIRRSTVDHVVSQPSDGGEDSILSDLAVFDEGGPSQDAAAGERTTESPSGIFPPQHAAEDIFACGGSGSNSYDSDDAPRASCVGGGDTSNVDRHKEAWERPRSPVSPRTSFSVPPTTGTPDRARGGTSLCLAGSATEPAPQPQRSSQEWRVGRHRVEVMQRDGAGQEWKEISPLTSPVVAGGPSRNFSSFTCSEDSTPSAPPIVGDHERKEQGSEKTMGADDGVDEEEKKATPSCSDEAKLMVVVAPPLPEVDGESEGTMQTAMEALDVSDDDGSAKASCAIAPSTVPPPVGAAGENVGDVSSDSADEASAETGTAPNEPEGTLAMEALDVSDDDDSAKASRAMSPSTVPPPVGADESICDISSDSIDEAAAETGAALNESEGTIAMEAPDVSDDDGSVDASRTRSPSAVPPPVGADEIIGDVSSDSADEAAAETGTDSDAPERTMQLAMEALDVSDDDGSVKASRALSPSTVPPPVGAAESIGDVSSDSADGAAAETGEAPNDSEGTMQTAMEALDVSDGEDPAKASRTISPSTVRPLVGTAEENVGGDSSDSVEEAAAETGAAPNESESTFAMEALDVSGDDGSAKVSHATSPSTVPPAVGAEENIGDVSPDSADEAAAKTGTAPDAPEGIMQSSMEVLDVSDGEDPAKTSRAISPSTPPRVEAAEYHIGGVSSDSANEAAAETGTAPNESGGTTQTTMEELGVSDGNGAATASHAISPSTAPPPMGADENVGDVSSDSADEAAAETDAAPNEPGGTMQPAMEALDVSDDKGSFMASRARSPSTRPPPVGAEENIGGVSSDSADETTAETGTAPNKSEGTTQTAMEELDVSDGNGSAKTSRGRTPSTPPPPMGADENVGDVSSDSADEAAAETDAAPSESGGTIQPAMEALDVSDDKGSFLGSRARSPSTVPPPVGVEDNIGGVSSDSADEAAAETGTAPNESEGTTQTAMEELDVSDGNGSAKASRGKSPSTTPPPMGADENIGDVSSDSADEAAAETDAAPSESGGTMQPAMEALDVSDDKGSFMASRTRSPSTVPPPVGVEENIGSVSSDSADEAAAETGTAPNESEGAMQTAMEGLDVSDGNGSAKASRGKSPSTGPPPMGADENFGDVSSNSADEAAAETDAAPSESGGTMQPAMEALDVSDDEGTPKASRAISPSTAPPPMGGKENVGDASSDSADEAPAATGAAPNESEGAMQTAMEGLDISDGNGSLKAPRAISPSTAPPMGAEDNIGDVSSDSADEAAVGTGTAPSESEGTMQPAMEAIDVSDGESTPKASRAVSPSTVPPVGAGENVGEVSPDSADEAAAETGTAPASPVDEDLPRFPTGLAVNADANEGDQCCESVATPLSSAAVESSDVALENSAERASPARANIEIGVERDDHCVHTMVVGDDSMQPFQPEVVTVPVGARVMWKRCSDSTNDDEPETFNVRQGCPIVETGWRTEFSFSIGGAQPTFIGTFERAGRFVISSDASPPGADRKRGEVVVESDASHSESDSFASPDDVRTSSEGFASGNEGSSCTPGVDNDGSFGQGSPRLAPSSMVGSQHAPQDLISNSCASPASDGADGRDCDDRGLVAASPTESREDLHSSPTTAEPVRSCVGPALVLSGMAIPPYVAVAGTDVQTTVEAPFPTRWRPRSLPPILGARGTGRSEGSELSDGRGWMPADRLGVLEGSKVDYVASETRLSPVAATSQKCLRSPRLLSDPCAPAGLPAMSGSKPSLGGSGGGGGGGGADSGNDCGVSDTDVDDDRQSLANAFAVPNDLQAGASVQEESFPSVTSACAPSAVPGGEDELEEPLQLAPETRGAVQVEYEEEAAAAVGSARNQEDERTAQPPPKTSQSKKKKAKKKKKKTGGGGGGGGDGGGGSGSGGLGGDVGGRRTSRGSSADTSKIPVGEDSSAMLLDEETFSEVFGDSATGVGGGSGKTSAKTLIVGDRGFKPWKPVVVQVGGTVSIKAANVWPNGGIRQDRALSISLVGPVVCNEETRRFFEGSNKPEDMPDESRFKKTAPSGRALVAVFRMPGEYWLIDHLAGKRIKVTAVAREAATPAAQTEPGLPTPSGKQGNTSLLRGADSSAEATQRRGGNNGSEVTSRWKKKSRGNDVLSEVAALAKDIDTTSAGNPAVVLKSLEVAKSAGRVSEAASGFDLFAGDTPGMVDGGSSEVRRSTPTTTVEAGLPEQVLERAPSPTWLPPIRVMREGDLSLDNFAWFSRFDAVHGVRVSHKKGFEPATLETALSPGLGALVICELDAKQRVTREVLCRWLEGGAGDDSGAAKGRGEDGGGAASRAAAARNDVETDSQAELSTRLGPGSLKKCHFVLGRFGEYQLSYRHGGKRGLTVVVKPPDVAKLTSTSASNTNVACDAGVGPDSVNSSGQDQPPESPRTRRLRDQMPETAEGNSSSEVAGEGGSPDSAEVPSDEDSAAMSGSTTGSAEAVPHERCPIDDPGLESIQAQQDVVAEDTSMAVAAVGGSGGFCWEDAMPDRDQNQGDFVQQRSHVKRIKRQKVKIERAEAAKSAAAAAALLEAAAATAEAAAAEAVVGKPTRLDESAVTANSAVRTGPSAKETETGVPTATGPPTDKPTPEEPPAAKNSIWKASLSETGSQRATAVDKVASSVNSCLDQKPPNSPVVSAKAGCEASAPPGAAVVNKDALSSPAGEFGRVEPATAKPVAVGRRKARKQFDGESLDSPRTSAPAEPVVLAPTGVKKKQRKRELGERKSGVHTSASARNSAGAKSTEPAQENPVAKETAATATGWGVAVSGASWSDGVGSTRSEVRAGVLPEGCNAARPSRAAPRPYAHQSPAAPPRVPHRRWDSPRGAAFSQPHAPPQSAHGRGWNAPISGGSTAPVTSNWTGVSATAPVVSSGDHNYSPSCAEGDGRGVIQKGGTGKAEDGHGSVALSALPAEVPGLAGFAQTASEVPTIADSQDNARVANQPATHSHQGNVAGRATASSDSPVVGGVGGLPGAHLMAGDRATEVSHEEGGGYGRRNRPGAEPARTSSRMSANSRSSSFLSSPSEPALSAGSNVPAIGKQKSKKKARAERKAANAAAAGAVVGEAAFSGEPKPSATLEVSAGQPHAASTKTTTRPVKSRKGDSQTGPSSRSGISFGDFVLPAKTAAGRAAGAFSPSAPGRRDVAGDRAPASTPGSSGRAGAGHGRSGEGSGLEGKKVAASGGDAKFGQASRGRPGPARSETAGGWRASEAASVPKPATAGASAPPSGLGDRPARPPPYEQPAEKEEGSASEGRTVGNPETTKSVTERAPAPPSGLGDRPARTPPYKKPAKKEKPAEKEEVSSSEGGKVENPETPEGATLSTGGVVASPTAASSPKNASDPPSEKSEQPRWGNCSTKVSFEERTRRSQAHRGARLPRGHRRETRGRPRPAAFPEASRLPGGGYSMPEGPDDRLPPPSAYEIEESARMMKIYDDMMERLNTTGFDEELPNGFRPKIFDLTDG